MASRNGNQIDSPMKRRAPEDGIESDASERKRIKFAVPSPAKQTKLGNKLSGGVARARSAANVLSSAGAHSNHTRTQPASSSHPSSAASPRNITSLHVETPSPTITHPQVVIYSDPTSSPVTRDASRQSTQSSERPSNLNAPSTSPKRGSSPLARASSTVQGSSRYQARSQGVPATTGAGTRDSFSASPQRPKAFDLRVRVPIEEGRKSPAKAAHYISESRNSSLKAPGWTGANIDNASGTQSQGSASSVPQVENPRPESRKQPIKAVHGNHQNSDQPRGGSVSSGASTGRSSIAPPQPVSSDTQAGNRGQESQPCQHTTQAALDSNRTQIRSQEQPSGSTSTGNSSSPARKKPVSSNSQIGDPGQESRKQPVTTGHQSQDRSRVNPISNGPSISGTSDTRTQGCVSSDDHIRNLGQESRQQQPAKAVQKSDRNEVQPQGQPTSASAGPVDIIQNKSQEIPPQQRSNDEHRAQQKVAQATQDIRKKVGVHRPSTSKTRTENSEREERQQEKVQSAPNSNGKEARPQIQPPSAVAGTTEKAHSHGAAVPVVHHRSVDQARQSPKQTPQESNQRKSLPQAAAVSTAQHSSPEHARKLPSQALQEGAQSKGHPQEKGSPAAQRRIVDQPKQESRQLVHDGAQKDNRPRVSPSSATRIDHSNQKRQIPSQAGQDSNQNDIRPQTSPSSHVPRRNSNSSGPQPGQLTQNRDQDQARPQARLPSAQPRSISNEVRKQLEPSMQDGNQNVVQPQARLSSSNQRGDSSKEAKERSGQTVQSGLQNKTRPQASAVSVSRGNISNQVRQPPGQPMQSGTQSNAQTQIPTLPSAQRKSVAQNTQILRSSSATVTGSHLDHVQSSGSQLSVSPHPESVRAAQNLGDFSTGTVRNKQHHAQPPGTLSPPRPRRRSNEVTRSPNRPFSSTPGPRERSHSEQRPGSYGTSKYDSQILIRQPMHRKDHVQHIVRSGSHASRHPDNTKAQTTHETKKIEEGLDRAGLKRKLIDGDVQDGTTKVRRLTKQTPRRWVGQMPLQSRALQSPAHVPDPKIGVLSKGNLVGITGHEAPDETAHGQWTNGQKTIRLFKIDGKILPEHPRQLLNMIVAEDIVKEDMPTTDEDISKYKQVIQLLETQEVNTETGQQRPPKPMPPSPDYRFLALGKIRKAKDNGEDCNFCNSQTNYGNSDQRLWLPQTNAYSYCGECRDEPCEGTAWLVSTEKGHNKYHFENELSSVVAARVASESSFLLPSDADLGPRQPLMRYIQGEDRDMSKYSYPQLCRSCPWSQLNITLLKMCRGCREEKMKIIKHKTHQCTVPYYQIDPLPTDRRCHVCTNMAEFGCKSCPLLVCIGCSSILENMCKNQLTMLFYVFKKTHIRNDAFILRDDGAGF
ncbi:hypothetical protein PVAG01_05216 [Phlyctema vagabunda]|uniref:Uncharacterized protein n=1 Tax=Phlyctema vagabunda TaxID=108571 RepID=A0ABR4PJE5_9HELO